MITGFVTQDLEAIVRVTVHDRDGRGHEMESVVDTGFDGSLTLPASVIALLGLRWCRRGRPLLADGRESVCDIFEATISWDGSTRRIPVDAAETAPLIGMSLLHGYELIIRIVDGGDVTITALP
ncbi:MAG: clan AA aspartic protease [Acidobacteriota bacterium]